MKIQLQSLRVINCGPLRDVCIHFAADGESSTTVLAGANGSGKTTVLELIAALIGLLDWDTAYDRTSVLRKPAQALLDRTEYACLDCLVDEKPLSIRYSQAPVQTVQPEGIFAVYPLSVDRLGYPASNSPAYEIEQRIKTSKKHILSFSNLRHNVVSVSMPSVLYFPYNRSFLPIKGDQLQREETKYEWIYRYEVVQTYAGSLDSYLIWLEYIEPENYAAAIQFLNEIDIEGKTFGISRRDLKAVVTTSNGGSHFLEDMSSGEQNLLIMLLELRRRLLPHSIVMIDEIENSLHPAFQHRIVNGLKRMQEMIPFQLIVTSHSLTILEAFGTQTARILTQF